MGTIRLAVIDEVPIDAIRLKADDAHIHKGTGTIDTVCGLCERVMAIGISPADLAPLYPGRLVVLDCSCGAHNAVPR